MLKVWYNVTISNKRREKMNREQILNSVKMLAQSQGSYGRLYSQLKDNEEALQYLEAQQFTDVVDLILFLES